MEENKDSIILLNEWFISNHKEYYQKPTEFRNEFNKFIVSKIPKLASEIKLNKNFINVLANMFLSVKSFYPNKFNCFTEFLNYFNTNFTMRTDCYINFGILSIHQKNLIVNYVNALFFISNFIVWKKNKELFYPLVTKISLDKDYKFNGSDCFEVVSSKITKYIFDDFDDSSKQKSNLTDGNIANSNIINKESYYQIKKCILVISANSAFERYKKPDEVQCEKNISPTNQINSLSKLNLEDNDVEPNRKKKKQE
jgi:hypothetical protein